MMSVISISTPEVIILRKVLRSRLIAVFVGVVTAGIPRRRLSLQRAPLKPDLDGSFGQTGARRRIVVGYM